MVNNLSTMRETWVQSLGLKDPLEEGIATHSSTLAWRISMDRGAWWLQSMRSQRVGHDWATKSTHPNQQHTPQLYFQNISWIWGFPGASVVKNLLANAGDTGLILGLGRSHMLRGNKACRPQLLSMYSGTLELQRMRATWPGAMPHTKRSHAMSSPHNATRE